MAVTTASFRAQFPEFTDAPEDGVVSRCLDMASLFSAGFPVGTVQDLATSYYAAHLITRDPRGEPSALAPYGGGTTTVMMANVQAGNRFAKGTDPYLQAYLDIRATHIIPILVT